MKFVTRIKKNWHHYFFVKHVFRPQQFFAIKVGCTMVLFSAPFAVAGVPYIGVTVALGIVAAALSETDDHPRGRLKALGITITSFALVTSAVSYFLHNHLVFGGGLVLLTILFVLIGGISERYRAISFGVILIAIYVMIGNQEGAIWYLQPLYLCGGALAYGLVSFFLLVLRKWRPLEEQLATGFLALSQYLEEKAEHFCGTDQAEQNRLSVLNIQVVTALEKSKSVLNAYEKEVDDPKMILISIQRFMLLQSLHERAASKHDDYDKLAEKKKYKSILEGFSEVLLQLAHAANLAANSMLSDNPYKHPVALGWVLSSLEQELGKLSDKERQPFELFLHNLKRSHQSLKNFYNPGRSTSVPRLKKDERSIIKRFTDQLSFSHPRLQYAIRLSTCFLIGYLIHLYSGVEKGEWIMLTSLFVSQSSYMETRNRFFQRVAGTLTGLGTGVLLLYVVPTYAGLWVLFLLSGFLFFYWLRSRYTYAVFYITVFVLAANEMTLGAGIDVLLPRVTATLIGAALSYLVNLIMWPNWQYKQVPGLLSGALKSNAEYLEKITTAEHIHASDDYQYRIARRKAHVSDNALTMSWRSMQLEPRKYREEMRHAYNLTYLNHALLSYISALGALQENRYFFRKSKEFDRKIVGILLETSEKIRVKEEPRLAALLAETLMELKNSVDTLPVGKERQLNRLFYNIAEVSHRIVLESGQLCRLRK